MDTNPNSSAHFTINSENMLSAHEKTIKKIFPTMTGRFSFLSSVFLS
jgi:hypothetical protein